MLAPGNVSSRKHPELRVYISFPDRYGHARRFLQEDKEDNTKFIENQIQPNMTVAG